MRRSCGSVGATHAAAASDRGNAHGRAGTENRQLQRRQENISGREPLWRPTRKIGSGRRLKSGRETLSATFEPCAAAIADPQKASRNYGRALASSLIAALVAARETSMKVSFQARAISGPAAAQRSSAARLP